MKGFTAIHLVNLSSNLRDGYLMIPYVIWHSEDPAHPRGSFNLFCLFRLHLRLLGIMWGRQTHAVIECHSWPTRCYLPTVLLAWTLFPSDIILGLDDQIKLINLVLCFLTMWKTLICQNQNKCFLCFHSIAAQLSVSCCHFLGDTWTCESVNKLEKWLPQQLKLK